MIPSGHGFPSRNRGVLFARPVFVGEMHQKRHAGFRGGHHRSRTHRVDLDCHTHLLPLVQHGAEILHLLSSRPGNRSQDDFACEFDSHSGHLPDLAASRFLSEIA